MAQLLPRVRKFSAIGPAWANSSRLFFVGANPLAKRRHVVDNLRTLGRHEPGVGKQFEMFFVGANPLAKRRHVVDNLRTLGRQLAQLLPQSVKILSLMPQLLPKST